MDASDTGLTDGGSDRSRRNCRRRTQRRSGGLAGLECRQRRAGPSSPSRFATSGWPAPNGGESSSCSIQPVTRQEGTAVWALDPAGFKELLELCQADTRNNVLQAPKMIARVGDPARMTSEETDHYVASLKRVADGPPNQSTKLAFEPQVDKVHNGVRVNILSSQLKGQNLFARVVIEENRLVAIHMAKYTEGVQPKPGADPEVVQGFVSGPAESEPRTSRGGPQRHDPGTRGGQPAGRGRMADSQRWGTAGQPRAASPAREGLSKGVRGAPDRHHRPPVCRAGSGPRSAARQSQRSPKPR